jgi:hypothetical protein
MGARKSSTLPQLTEGQAMYVVTRLIENGRLRPADVSRFMKDMAEEIELLEQRLRLLRDAQPPVRRGRRGRAVLNDGADDARTKPAKQRHRKRRHQNLSPERRAKLKLQGQYLALMRPLSQRKRSQYKKLFREKGLEATVQALREASEK